jgi:mono/diheme cytochrome c family protein
MRTNAFLVLLFLAGCGPGSPLGDSSRTSTSPVDQTSSSPPPATDPPPVANPDPPPPAQTGFPCAVRAVLQTNCASCHTGAGYIQGFKARADFLADTGDGVTLGQLMVGRLTSAERPMPPSGMEQKPSADEVATLSAWVESGMPAGACGDLIRP